MIDFFCKADVAPFLAMANEEGWVCGQWELEFLRQTFPQGCLVCREGDRTVAFITSVGYGNSGWIGNLLVHQDCRSRGLGRRLMERAVFELLKSGVQTIWLTASIRGAELYRKLGFNAIDSIERWSGKGQSGDAPEPAPTDLESLRESDRAGWGDRRESLLQVTCGRGRLYCISGGFICCQQWEEDMRIDRRQQEDRSGSGRLQEDGKQIGPWSCLIESRAGQLLDRALAGAGERVFLDVPAGNRAAAALLKERGFAIRASNLLMYLGAEPQYRPENIYALASMGSMG